MLSLVQQQCDILIDLLIDSRGREELQPGGLWVPGVPLSVLQAGAEVSGTTHAQRLPGQPQPQHADGAVRRLRSLQVSW